MAPKTFSDLETRWDSFYTPTFAISVDGGATFSTAQGRVSSVSVRTAIDRANRVSFSVAGVYDPSAGDFTGLADAGLTEGSGLTVRLGYGSDPELVMTGEITAVKPNFPDGGPPTVDVVGHDYRYAMSQSSGDESWDESSVTAATRSIANRYGFRRVDIGSGGPGGQGASDLELERLVKDATSDFDFLTALTERFDYEMFSEAGVLRFRRPTRPASPTVALTYGRGLRSFQPGSRSGKSNVGTVEHRGVNHYTGESVSGSSQRADGDGEKLLMKAAMESDTEAQRRSAAQSTALDRERRSTATTLGLPDLRIGEWVHLDGLGSVGGQSFDGPYYLLEVDHTLGESGYTTNATLTGPRTEQQ